MATYSHRLFDRKDLDIFLSIYWDKKQCDHQFWIKVHGEFSLLFSRPGCTNLTLLNEAGEAIAFLSTALLKPSFVEILKSASEPDIVTKLVADDSVLFVERDIADGNAREELCGCVIAFSIVNSIHEAEIPIIKSHLMDLVVEAFSGYLLQEIYIEVHTEELIDNLFRAGFCVANDYSSWWEEHLNEREVCPKLMSVDKHTARLAKDFHVLRMFVADPPKLALTDVHRETLYWALQDRTNEEICEELDLNNDALVARWRSIYLKCSRILPGDPVQSFRKRGDEKRRKVIRYVREHPEELRPYNYKLILPANGRTPGKRS